MTPFTTNWVRIISVAVFSVSFALGMALVAWYEIAEVTHDTPLATIIAIIIKGQAVVVVSTGLAGVIEGGAYIVVIAHHIVQRGIEKGRQEGIAEGIAIGQDKGRAEGRVEGRAEGRDEGRTEGRAEGRTEGRDEAYEDAARQNEAYYKRMREALDAGEDFDEPPPMFNRNGR